MSNILLTNDDGVDSPALTPFATALDALGTVRVCVPDSERSWVGKAITRHGGIDLQEVERDGRTVHTTSGYPADAAQLGIHELGDVDLVISGINLGHNHGTSFMMSSGTVGAAVEGWINGLPAMAFSTGVWGRGYGEWRRWCTSADAVDDWHRLAKVCANLARDILESGLAATADVVSVNLPFASTEETPRRITTIARARYGRLFRSNGDGHYRHSFSDSAEFVSPPGTDVAAAEEGMVSITPIQLPTALEPDAETATMLLREGDTRWGPHSDLNAM